MRGENNIITNYSFCNAQIFYRKIMANQSVSKVFYSELCDDYIQLSCCVFCRFSLVYRAGQAVTALCCSISRPSEVLVGLPDHSVLCVDLGMCVPLSLN